jgi:hypothetical protein
MLTQQWHPAIPFSATTQPQIRLFLPHPDARQIARSSKSPKAQRSTSCPAAIPVLWPPKWKPNEKKNGGCSSLGV